MLTREDCFGLCDLTPAEISALAEHAHIPELVAAEMGQYLISLPDGEKRIKAIIRDDIAAAQTRGDHRHAAVLKHVLRDFARHHGLSGQ